MFRSPLGSRGERSRQFTRLLPFPRRLRFSFVNVAAPPSQIASGNPSQVNMGRTPVLASCFSDVFTVFSAKKFPGVCESTPLSKQFAHQGIKIPIRKEANSRGGDDEDDY